MRSAALVAASSLAAGAAALDFLHAYQVDGSYDCDAYATYADDSRSKPLFFAAAETLGGLNASLAAAPCVVLWLGTNPGGATPKGDAPPGRLAATPGGILDELDAGGCAVVYLDECRPAAYVAENAAAYRAAATYLLSLGAGLGATKVVVGGPASGGVHALQLVDWLAGEWRARAAPRHDYPGGVGDEADAVGVEKLGATLRDSAESGVRGQASKTSDTLFSVARRLAWIARGAGDGALVRDACDSFLCNPTCPSSIAFRSPATRRRARPCASASARSSRGPARHARAGHLPGVWARARKIERGLAARAAPGAGDRVRARSGTLARRVAAGTEGALDVIADAVADLEGDATMTKAAYDETLRSDLDKMRSITAVMGPSGSGKSTLLEVVCGARTAGSIAGDLALSGASLLAGGPSRRLRDWYRTSSAFVPQQDVFLASLTGGLSGGQRRRLSVFQHTLAAKQFLFLDEPTSGLDATSSLVLLACLDAMKNGDGGKCVVLTIHQPRQEVFDYMDQVVVLVKGRVAYDGAAAAST
ncbi:ATPase [Aureococcus anophagefferens]|nr:ATPase [Aureococcus anophagefferens]